MNKPNKQNKPNKLNITNDFRKKLEGLYLKKNQSKKIEKNKSTTNIKKIIQPQKNVILKNNLEEITEISNIHTNNSIIITIKINSYYQVLLYTLVLLFSLCLSTRIMYILFLL